MQRNKQKQDLKHQTKTKKQQNQFKALYQITKQRRIQLEESQIRESSKCNDKNIKQAEKVKSQRSKYVEDSLDNVEIVNEEDFDHKNGEKFKTSDNINQANYKKMSHNRSQSCPFMNLPTAIIKQQQKYQVPHNKYIIENESKRTLKKISTMHKKNNRIKQKYSIGHCSQLSQESNTVIVHSLPIEHLSSMLYSLNHKEERNFKKVGSSASKFQHHVFSIHNDLYFQTRLQQQIKMYDLNEELRNLHKETQNVKVKQQVLQKLANKFDRQDGQTDEEDSLLIH